MLPDVNLSDDGKQSASFCKNNEIVTIPHCQMYIYIFAESDHYIKNNEIVLSLQLKNISIFNIIKLPLHKKLIKMDFSSQPILVTSDFYCTFPIQNILWHGIYFNKV
jgi:hypothetical protein